MNNSLNKPTMISLLMTSNFVVITMIGDSSNHAKGYAYITLLFSVLLWQSLSDYKRLRQILTAIVLVAGIIFITLMEGVEYNIILAIQTAFFLAMYKVFKVKLPVTQETDSELRA